ncbi:MAG: hypothetical protein JWM82_2818, partial [Myxococcales bacterium]|nr:hypothetical protein [Myxococcales bacterium]
MVAVVGAQAAVAVARQVAAWASA